MKKKMNQNDDHSFWRDSSVDTTVSYRGVISHVASVHVIHKMSIYRSSS
jgi:hypothetical protein